MISYLLLTAVGPDRPGLVDELSARLVKRGMNIEASRMAALGGDFAVILLASGEESEAKTLAADPAVLGVGIGLTVFVKPTTAPGTRSAAPALPYRLGAAGMDHPGIIHVISKTLHAHGVNIESMDTDVKPAPVSGAPMFTMTAVLSTPASVKIRKLKESLAELGDELNMDLELEPLESKR